MRDRYFVCDSCGCVDSTSSGTFNSFQSEIIPASHRGKRECCECAPVYDTNGRTISGNGRWHGRFKKRKATVELIYKNRSDFTYLSHLADDVSGTQTSHSLSSCRQCGSSEVGVARTVSFAAVVCLQCGFAGLRCGTIKEAIGSWNVLGK